MKNVIFCFIIALTISCNEEETPEVSNCDNFACDLFCQEDQFGTTGGACENDECMCQYPEDCHPWNCGGCAYDIQFCDHHCNELPYSELDCQDATGGRDCDVEGVCESNICACNYVPVGE